MPQLVPAVLGCTYIHTEYTVSVLRTVHTNDTDVRSYIIIIRANNILTYPRSTYVSVQICAYYGPYMHRCMKPAVWLD